MAARRHSYSPQQRVGQLQAEIGRQRRRIDRRIDKLADKLLVAVAPRRFVRKYPLRALLSAAGIGVLLGQVSKARIAESWEQTVRRWLNSPSWTQAIVQLRNGLFGQRGKSQPADAEGADNGG